MQSARRRTGKTGSVRRGESEDRTGELNADEYSERRSEEPEREHAVSEKLGIMRLLLFMVKVDILTEGNSKEEYESALMRISICAVLPSLRAAGCGE